MLYESNYFRLQSLRYTPLLLGLLWFIPFFIAEEIVIVWQLMISLMPGIVLIILFFHLNKVLRFVTLGRTEIFIRIKGNDQKFDWMDVEEISLNRLFGLYHLKIKDMDAVYFTPYGRVTWFFGDQSEMGALIDKMKRDLDI